MPMLAILAVLSAHVLAADAPPNLAIQSRTEAKSFEPSEPIYVDFGEFVYRVVELQMSSRGDPIDINNLSIDFIYSDALDIWFDFVLT